MSKKPIEKMSVSLAAWNNVAKKSNNKKGLHGGPPTHVHIDARHDLNPFVLVKCSTDSCGCVSSTLLLPPSRASVVFLPPNIELEEVEANIVSFLGNDAGLGEVDHSRLI